MTDTLVLDRYQNNITDNLNILRQKSTQAGRGFGEERRFLNIINDLILHEINMVDKELGQFTRGNMMNNSGGGGRLSPRAGRSFR